MALHDIELTTLDGSGDALDAARGKVTLVVNVASQCGLTPQYEGLGALYRQYRDRGFTVVGVPCNQFLEQEPGTHEEIVAFCSTTYGVDFPLLAKQDVNGADRSPLYQWLVGSEAGGGKDIGWNFGKFLVGRDGKVIARFEPKTAPDSPEITKAIEAALAAK